MAGVGSKTARLGELSQQRLTLCREHTEGVSRVDRRHPELEFPGRWVEVDHALDTDPDAVGHADRIAVALEETVDPVTGVAKQHDRHRRDGRGAGGLGRFDQVEVDVIVAAAPDALDFALNPHAVRHCLFERSADRDPEFGDGERLIRHIGDGSRRIRPVRERARRTCSSLPISVSSCR